MPSAALRIIVPKTLAYANIQKSQRKAFHMKNSLKNCRGGAVRSPSAALGIIVPKTLACANIQKSQRKAFHMKNLLMAAQNIKLAQNHHNLILTINKKAYIYITFEKEEKESQVGVRKRPFRRTKTAVRLRKRPLDSIVRIF